MTTIEPPVPPPFTSEDFAARMRRVVDSAVEKGLAGVIVTPGPDLVWLTGYQPTADLQWDGLSQWAALTGAPINPMRSPTATVSAG